VETEDGDTQPVKKRLILQGKFEIKIAGVYHY
jgi:hypothetical protein